MDQEELEKTVAFAISPKFNPNRLESYWYPVYKTLFKVLESATDTVIAVLAPQFTVSRVFRQETEEMFHRPRTSNRQPGLPPSTETYISPKTGKTFSAPVKPFPDPSEEFAQSITSVKEHREWRIPNFALVVCQDPKTVVRMTGRGTHRADCFREEGSNQGRNDQWKHERNIAAPRQISSMVRGPCRWMVHLRQGIRYRK